MKKMLALCVMALFVFAGTAFGQTVNEIEWKNANQFTCSWDAVTTDVDGDPIHSGPVTYEVLLANATTDPNKTNPVVAAETDALNALITLGVKGAYYVGVRAIWLGEPSAINWADEPANQEEVALWGARFAVPPGVPKKLIKQ
jgi:hypothetical protein